MTYRPRLLHRAGRCAVDITPAGHGWWWVRCHTCDTTDLKPGPAALWPNPYAERNTK